MTVLIIVEYDQHKILKSANLNAITAATQLNEEIHLLVIGHDCQNMAEKAASLPHVEKVWVADNPVYAHQLAENVAALIASIATHYSFIMATNGTFAKNLLPRVASLCNVSMISDVIEIKSKDTFVRPIYAGNALATVRSSDSLKIMTIRAPAFLPLQNSVSKKSASIEEMETVISNTLSCFVSHELTISSRPELTEAHIIISGGRGLKSAENFHLLEKIADKLGAAIGASRAAVDAGFAPNDYQVGQTGKMVAPDLYIAVGISGAIQHMAGMKDSKVIVAINNDPEAPIFEIADYGLVADLFTVIPELMLALEK